MKSGIALLAILSFIALLGDVSARRHRPHTKPSSAVRNKSGQEIFRTIGKFLKIFIENITVKTSMYLKDVFSDDGPAFKIKKLRQIIRDSFLIGIEVLSDLAEDGNDSAYSRNLDAFHPRAKVPPVYQQPGYDYPLHRSLGDWE